MQSMSAETIFARRSEPWNCLLVVQPNIIPDALLGDGHVTGSPSSKIGRVRFYTRPSNHADGPFTDGWNYWGDEFRSVCRIVAPHAKKVLSYDTDTASSANMFTASKYFWHFKSDSIRIDTMDEFAHELWPQIWIWGVSLFFRNPISPLLNDFVFKLQREQFDAVKQHIFSSLNDWFALETLLRDCEAIMIGDEFSPPECGDPYFLLRSTQISPTLIHEIIRPFSNADMRFYTTSSSIGLREWLLNGVIPAHATEVKR